MSINPAILYILNKRRLSRRNSEFSIFYSHNDEITRSYAGANYEIWESEEAFIQSRKQEAVKLRAALIHSINNDLIAPMSVPKDIEGHEPPAKALSLFSRFLEDCDKDAVWGDLTEEYNQKAEELGAWRADKWFYAEVARSLWPLVRRSVSKTIKLAVLGEWIRRMIQ